MAPRLIVIAILGIAATGCVSQGKYNALKLEKDQLVEQLSASETARARAEAEAASWKSQFDKLMEQGGEASKLALQYQKELAAKSELYDKLMEDYNRLKDQAGKVTSALPAGLSDDLERLAKDSNGVMTFDRERGLIKFASDVTFASGSAELTPQAKTVIAKLAQILNSGQAANYEMLVAGHTDNTRVVHEATLKAGHKDNWFLSAHRSISVGAELMSHQVSQRRLGVVGYADQRPVASNATSEGKARNRRVEVLLLPTTYRAGAVAETPRAATKTPATPVRARTPELLNKDTVTNDPRPVYTK